TYRVRAPLNTSSCGGNARRLIWAARPGPPPTGAAGPAAHRLSAQHRPPGAPPSAATPRRPDSPRTRRRPPQPTPARRAAPHRAASQGAHADRRARRTRARRRATAWERPREGRMSAETTARQARVERKTKETEVSLQLNLDGTGASKVQTPIPFFSHMLEAWAKHGLMDLAVEAQ